MSDSIVLTGISGFGFHGVFDHERINGQNFFVDVELHVDLLKASKSDDLVDTVNYGLITELVVKEITGEPVSLIERLAGRIAEKILVAHQQVLDVTVTVHKPDAPVGIVIKDIAVQITRSR